MHLAPLHSSDTKCIYLPFLPIMYYQCKNNVAFKTLIRCLTNCNTFDFERVGLHTHDHLLFNKIRFRTVTPSWFYSLLDMCLLIDYFNFWYLFVNAHVDDTYGLVIWHPCDLSVVFQGQTFWGLAFQTRIIRKS